VILAFDTTTGPAGERRPASRLSTAGTKYLSKPQDYSTPPDALMDSESSNRPVVSSDAAEGFIGVTYGDIGTTTFKCSAIGPVDRNDFVQVRHWQCGIVLGRVEQIERKTDLSLEKAQLMSDGEPVEVDERVSAMISVIGYRDDRGLLQVPRTPFKAGESVFKAEDSLIRQVIGLLDSEKRGAYLGLLNGHEIPIYLDINAIVQKHVSVLAKTGGGKSYVVGVLMEEFMKHGVTVVIIDPHGEYSSLREKSRGEIDRKFDVHPRGYADQVLEFSPDVKVNPGAHPLRFTLGNLEARDIMGLTNLSNQRTHLLQLRKVLDSLRMANRPYTMSEIIALLDAEDDPTVGALVDQLEYLREVDIFAKEGTKIDELVVKGKCTIINLKGSPPDIQELIVNRIATALFELRKVGKVPPMLMVLEESHNFCPQVGVAQSSKILRTIASEGRKFGLGLLIVTQRAAKVDKNVLSQCNTQIILKVTNPNDLKAITSSVEGLTTAMEEEVQRLPIGVAIVTGGGINMPLMVEIRSRETRHGGESVKVLPD